jgi:hypothetical protein
VGGDAVRLSVFCAMLLLLSRPVGCRVTLALCANAPGDLRPGPPAWRGLRP